MRQESLLRNRGLIRNQQSSVRTSRPPDLVGNISKILASTPRSTLVGTLLILALLAFELFNFDTTQYALVDLLGETSFMKIRWATILAVAFCAIDFAGLTYLFGPDRNPQNQREIWYLMGAWLLGATMNALMTWWAVSLSLLNHQNGNVILSHEQLLEFVPLLVAVLVWVTRILFIGAFSIAGSRLYGLGDDPAKLSRPILAEKPDRSSAGRPAPDQSGGNLDPIAATPGYSRSQERLPAMDVTGEVRGTSRTVSSGFPTRANRRSPKYIDRHRSPLLAKSKNSPRFRRQ